MFRLLIVGENLFDTDSIVNDIIKKKSNMNLFNIIFSNYTDAMQLIKNNIPDIILIILENYYNINNIDIIKYMEINKLSKYKKSTIVYIKNGDIPANEFENQYILAYINSITEFNELILNKSKKDEQEKQHILKKIKLEMEKLNFNFSYVGTKYLLECIFEIYSNKNYEQFNLNRDFYPIISQKYNKSINNIKCNITQAYIKMVCDSSIENLENYLKMYIGTQIPKKKDVISAILRNII